MAKIFYSGNVNTMSGKIGGSTASDWKGTGTLRKHNPFHRQKRTQQQQALRGYLSDLAGEFYALTDPQKQLWAAWAAANPKPITAQNAYILFNQRAQKYFPGTPRKTTPPPTPSTPTHLTGFAVIPNATRDFTIVWTSPTLTTLFVIADYWPLPGRDRTVTPAWTFGASAGANALSLLITTEYPLPTILKFRVRTLDAQYRVSPWSHILSVAPRSAGRYGISHYAAAYYGP